MVWNYCKYILPMLLAQLLSVQVGEAIVCYKCDSMVLEACAMSLDETDLPFEECKSSLQCVQSIVDGVTYRGCSGYTPTVGATYTKACNENLCNKGVYPPGRLKCHHCSEEGCVAPPVTKPHPCRIHHESDHCYTEIVTANEVYRGCKSDTNRTIMGAALYCDVNGCNDQAGASKLLCAECDSKEVRGCKMDLFEQSSDDCHITQYATCELDVLPTRQDSCFVYHNLDRVVRGCSSRMPEDVQNDEQLGAHLQQCSDGHLCNTQCIPQQRCLVCDSNTNANCRNDVSTVANNVCGSAEHSSCYACEYDDWQVQRGCGAVPQTGEVNRRYECSNEARCNDVSFTRCYQCSSAVNVNCATWERPGFDLDIEECQQANATCIVAAYAERSLTLRGCDSAQLQCNASTSSCSACEGSFCNKGAYPPQRLRCYQCVADAGDNCTQVVAQDAPPCLPVHLEPLQENEACFEYYDPLRSGMVRGCRSNFTEYLQCLRQLDAGAQCHICTADACNRSPTTRPPNLACYVCERKELSCQLEQTSLAQLTPCLKPVPFGYNESCYLKRHIDGTVSRGCTLDQWDESAQNPWDQTTYCTTSGCNSVATTAQYCIDCYSELKTNESCVVQPKVLEPHLCANLTGCYTLQTGTHLKRGCSDELTSPTLEHCMSTNKLDCVLCQGANCNMASVSQLLSLDGNRNDGHRLQCLMPLLVFQIYVLIG